jgi:hypothetical protein
VPEFFVAISTFLKSLQSKMALPMAIGSGFFVFASDSLLATVGVLLIKTEYGIYLGIVFIFSMAVITSSFVLTLKVRAIALIKYIHRKINQGRLLQERQALLSKLHPDEKGYIVLFITKGKLVLPLRNEDGIRGTLLAKDLIYVASNHGHLLTGLEYGLSPWVRKLVEENSDLLEGYSENMITHPSYF